MIDFAIFVQARLTSKRLPDKMFFRLGEKTILGNTLNRCILSGIKTFLLVPNEQIDDFLSRKEELNIDNGVELFSGSEDDVVERFYLCAKKNNVRNIIRITGDCPFVIPSMIKYLVNEYKHSSVDFLSNVKYNEYGDSLTITPSGFDIEVFSFNALALAHIESDSLEDREHVTKWIRRNIRSKKVMDELCVRIPVEFNFSIDQKNDLRFARKNYDLLNMLEFGDG